MPKSITIASIAYDVYDTTISSKTSRLQAVTAALALACDEYYDDQGYLIFTGPEYMFARKNYTRSTVPSGFEQLDPNVGADGVTQME